jgi:hypothetical protein
MKNKETNCEDVNWVGLTEENVQWCTLVAAVVSIWAVLSESYLNVTNFVSFPGSPEFSFADIELPYSMYISLKKE